MTFDESARWTALVNWQLGIVAFVALCAVAQFFFGWLIGFVVITPVIGVAVSVSILHRWFEKEVFPPMRKKAELRGEATAPING